MSMVPLAVTALDLWICGFIVFSRQWHHHKDFLYWCTHIHLNISLINVGFQYLLESKWCPHAIKCFQPMTSCMCKQVQGQGLMDREGFFWVNPKQQPPFYPSQKQAPDLGGILHMCICNSRQCYESVHPEATNSLRVMAFYSSVQTANSADVIYVALLAPQWPSWYQLNKKATGPWSPNNPLDTMFNSWTWTVL